MDSHLHLIDPTVLAYDWLAGPLDATFAALEINEEQLSGVDEEAAIFIQAEPTDGQALEEVRWVDSIALASGVVAIVAGARLDRGAATDEQLEALAASERVVGVRHLLQGEPDGYARTETFRRGARQLARRGWTFDACVRESQVADVTALAESVPDLPIVLDHLGKPSVGSASAPLAPGENWRRDLAALARHPQVFCKLSGLPAETGGVWTDAQITPFLDVALEAFGPDRLMWGSDWPVSSIADGSDYVVGSRQQWFRTVAEWAAGHNLDADAIFWSNALTFYGIR
ncbi:amidohydrolase family protein [Microbacterium esteraromaticum]|uniref:amidohydrolase family protein n=1 Tax=Microbacterium esteraromaticum TaxID=57043 RepID=UPI0019D3C109|nr:amidohydrolase family protein [Microbacterium esteraromaticum]MBN7794284.1 amidohydrolase family protein [Microbacterium esteraromaticum]